MYKKFLFILIHSLFISLWAQDVSVGHFKEYLPYNSFHSVAQDDENIYAATTQSILVVDKRNGMKEKWSKLNGLSEVGVQTIHSDNKGRLFIAYNNSNIDIIKNYQVHNIRDILNKQITGSKTINRISTFKELAYFACDFGVVVLDLKTLLVKDSWFTVRTGEAYRALFLTIHDDERYYLATDKGVFSLPVTASNPADFSLWMHENELPTGSYKLLCSYQNKLFAVYDGGTNKDTLFVYEDSHWKSDGSMNMQYYRSFDIKDDKMLVCDRDQVKTFTKDGFVQYIWTPWWQDGQMAILDEKMNIWVADNASGLVYINAQTGAYKTINAEGPANHNAYGLFFSDGTLAVVPGKRNTTLSPIYSVGAISTLKEDSWWYHNNFYNLKRPYAFNSVAINPLNTDEIYMASWAGGLFKINKTTNETFCYNRDNSILTVPERRMAPPNRDTSHFVSGLAIDNQNYLWMAHSEATDLVKVKDLKTTEEKWYSINIGVSDIMAEHILIDSRNYKWITLPKRDPEKQLVVFYENGSLTNSAVHKIAKVDLISQANVASSRTTCLAEDREGRIWIGSNQGVKVVYDAASVFNRTVYAKNVLLEQRIGDTSYVQNLLEFEYITCITVDAADRKWIGTQSSGVFLLSPSGTQELFHFTAENSPLFSNQINDIKINPENGEVFIATQDGLISYRGTATAGKETYKEVLVFPNPVRADYFGLIAVKGLMEDSFCKITDTSGNLVWQGYAYGGQLIWNGKNFYGKRPATGVYFVMASSKTGKEKKVAKFLFIQ